ncbi:Flp pilus assembly protein CpaB [Alkalicaulis satelles]|uniref:Flp pilus assembly protein CpaB n=1 Tax=Alkalicaulis satelles TaxID=2609175 RepID=A0A5M6ZBT7_9PROT|nr:Flp pilus assembly protein CpaB [Alkalicaulis satelles]KAA5802196.1 Flp pilus assembly protein CpaB [Alkalicaulis satelles]
MNAVRLIVLAVAGLAAVGAAVFVRSAMQPPATPAPAASEQPAPAPRVETARVLVAARDIAPGERVNASAFRWAPWPDEAVAPGYLTRARHADAIEQLTGAVARSAMVSGEPILERRLVQPGQAGFMAAVIDPGMRAVAVPISARSGAGGFILPNDRVDILVTLPANENFATRTVVENVRVLAIDQRHSEERDGAVVGSTATLELTPSQARAVSMAVASGTVSLALRSIADTEGGARLPDGADEERSGRVVRVFRYGEEQRVALGGGAP